MKKAYSVKTARDCGLNSKNFQELFNNLRSKRLSSNLDARFQILRLRSLRGKTGGGPAGAEPPCGGAPLLRPGSSPAFAKLTTWCTKSQTAGTGRKRSSPRTYRDGLFTPKRGREGSRRAGLASNSARSESPRWGRLRLRKVCVKQKGGRDRVSGHL